MKYKINIKTVYKMQKYNYYNKSKVFILYIIPVLNRGMYSGRVLK